MSTKTLQILISSNAEQAIKEVGKLVSEYGKLVQQLSKVQELSRGKSAATFTGSGLATGMKEAQKEIAKASKETESWIIKLSKLRESYRLAMGSGKTRIAEGNVKDMYRVLDNERKRLAGQAGQGDKLKYHNIEKAYQEVVNLTRKEQLLQSQAEKTNEALQKQGETVKTSLQAGTKAFSAGQDYPGIGNLKRQLKSIDQDLTNNLRSARAYANSIDKLEQGFTRLSNVEQGTVVIRRRHGVETRKSAAEMAQYQKELRLAEQHLQKLMEAAQRGGINVRKGTRGPLDEYERFSERQLGKWTQGSAGEGLLVHSKDDKERFIKDMEARGLAVQKARHWIRGYAGDVSHMMKMQIRWFTGAGIIFGAMGAFTMAAKGALEFQKAIKDIGAVTGATERELAKLSSRAIQISLVAPQSAVDLAKAASMLVKAGLEVDQVTGILDDVAKTATVSGDSLEAVGGAFSTAIMAWGMSTDEAQKIGDILAATLNYSRLNIEDLATAYNYVASTSSQFNLSFEETNAALAVFSNLGIRASTMATGFTQFLSSLADPPKDFKEAIEKSGQSFEEFAGILDDDRPDKIARLFKAMADAGFTTSTAFRTLEVRTARLVGAGLNAGSAAFARMNNKIRETKQLTEGFNKAMESTSNKLATFRNQMTAIAIHTFSAILPAIDVLVGALKMLATTLIYVSKGFETFGSWAVWASAGMVAVVYTLVRFGKELWNLTRIVAVSKGIFKGHPLFVGLTVLAGVLAFIGWLRGAGKDADEFSDSVDNSAEAMKRMSDEQKKAQKIYEDSEKFAKKYKEGLKRLHEEAKKPFLSPVPFGKWGVQADNFLQKYNQVVSDIKAGIDEIDDSLARLQKNNNTGEGWLGRLFAWGPPEGSVVSARRKWIGPDTDFLTDKPDAIDRGKFLTGRKGEKSREEILIERKKTAEEALKYAEAEKTKVAKDLMPALEKESVEQMLRYLSEWRKEAGITLTFAQKEKALQQDILNLLAQQIKSKHDKGELFTDSELAVFADGVKKLFISDEEALDKEEEAAIKAWDDYQASVVRNLEKNSAKDEVKKVWVDARHELESQLKQFLDAKEGALGLFGVSREVMLKQYEPAFKAVREAFEANMKGGTAEMPSFAGLEDIQWLRPFLEQFYADIKKSEEEIKLQRESSYQEILKDVAELSNGTEAVFLAEEKILESKRQQQLLELATIEDVKYREAMEQAINTLYEERLVKLAKARTLKQMEKRRSGYDLVELMGGDASRERRLLDFQVRLNELLLERPDLLEGGEEAAVSMYKAMEWDRLPLKDGFEGFLGALKLGTSEAVKQLGDGFEWAKRLGQDAVNALQRSSSDFFYNLSTAQGFNPEEHANFWEYFKDVVDDFLKSVYQSFMRTLADIWSQWLTSGIIDMLGGVLSGKNAMNRVDQQAIATNLNLTGTLAMQVGAVSSLTTAYWALAMAKMAAGFGGGGGFADGDAPVNMQQNWSGFSSSWVSKKHSGGLIMHQGGIVPRYHSGGLAPDERRAILQSGEMVINRRSTSRNLGTLMSINNGGDGRKTETAGSTVVQIFANDAKSFTDMVRRNPGAITSVVNRDMSKAGSTRSTMRRYL